MPMLGSDPELRGAPPVAVRERGIVGGETDHLDGPLSDHRNRIGVKVTWSRGSRVMRWGACSAAAPQPRLLNDFFLEVGARGAHPDVAQPRRPGRGRIASARCLGRTASTSPASSSAARRSAVRQSLFHVDDPVPGRRPPSFARLRRSSLAALIHLEQGGGSGVTALLDRRRAVGRQGKARSSTCSRRADVVVRFQGGNNAGAHACRR